MTENLNEQLRQAGDQKRRKEHLKFLLDRAQDQLSRERERLDGLEKHLQKEGVDVNRLESQSLTSLFYTILGSKEQQLEKERQELLAVRLKHAQSKHAVETLAEEVRDLREQIFKSGAPEARYESLLKEKEALLEKEGGELSRRLWQLSQDMSALCTELSEVEEAATAGKAVIASLRKMLEALESAGGWGVWDMLGGGMLVTMAKHSKIDEAREIAYAVQQQLRRFQSELADISSQDYFLADVGGLEVFADYFLDGLIVDWMVQQKINESEERTQMTLKRVKGIVKGLEKRQADLRDRHERLVVERRKFIEEAQ
jgi:hypothetical protein